MGSKESNRGHKDGRNKELTLKSRLNLNISRNDKEVSSNERGDPRDNQTKREKDKREVKSRPVVGDGRTRSSSNNHGSTRTLSKRTEEISTHTSDITDVITDVVGNNSRVTGIILRKVVTDLSTLEEGR